MINESLLYSHGLTLPWTANTTTLTPFFQTHSLSRAADLAWVVLLVDGGGGAVVTDECYGNKGMMLLL